MFAVRLRERLVPLALAVCALAGLGWTTPRIDPTGERLLRWDPLPGPAGPFPYAASGWGHFPTRPLHEPATLRHDHRNAVLVAPAKVVAPVGSEVLLQAAVCGQDGRLVANERVEWMIAPGSVGQFVRMNQLYLGDRLWGWASSPQKVTNTFAVGTSTSRFLRLTRGTPTQVDDAAVLKGESWITVTSPIEGVSHVTAFAPDVYAWDRHKQTAQIHWVDAQWALPPPAINPTGTRHTFTTTLTKHTNNQPLIGWIVRYEITGGPPAALAPDGTRVAEVPTNALGQASVEIFQTQPAAGTNTVLVEIIRPGTVPGADGSRVTVGQGATQKTWTAPDLAVRVTGPAEATPGSVVSYRITVDNPGVAPARDVVVQDPLLQGLPLVSAAPQPETLPDRLQWRLGTLQARESRTIEVNFRAENPGTIQHCVTVRSGEGLQAQSCATTTVTAPSLDVSVAGPSDAYVGDELVYVVTVRNRGLVPVGNLLLVDNFDAGLQHAVATTSPIENRSLGSLAPGEAKQLNVRFRAAQAGRWCHTVEVSGDSGAKATAQACVTVRDPAGPVPTPSPTPAPGPAPGGGERPVLSVRKTGPDRRNVGDVAEFVIEVTNTGRVAATNVKVADNYDLALAPKMATPGYQWVGRDLVWVVRSLPPGERIYLRVQSECLARAQRTCNRVTVTSDEGNRGDAEACLEIVTGGVNLSVSVADQRDPVAVGNETTYEILVTNNANRPDQQVALAVTLPQQLVLNQVGTAGPSQSFVQGNAVRFAPVAEIRPGETLTYRIRARALQPGDARIRVELTSTASPTPITAEETTTVFGP